MTTLVGRVTYRHRVAADGATVELHNADGDVLDQIQVDHKGVFGFYLIGGKWRLNCWDAHGRRAVLEVEVEQGEDKVVEIDLVEPRPEEGQ